MTGHVTFTPVIQSGEFRWYREGAADTATLLSDDLGQNERIVPSVHATYLLRVLVQETAGAGGTNQVYTLQANIGGGGAFIDITNATSKVRMNTASALTDGGALTASRISGGSGTFVNGVQEKSGNSITHSLTANNYTEFVWALEFVDADLTAGELISFRASLNGGAPGMTNPTITVQIHKFDATPQVDMTAFRFYNDGTEAGATVLGAENTNVTVDPSSVTEFQLRVRLQELDGGATGAQTWELLCRVNGEGPLRQIGNASLATTGVRIAHGNANSQLVNGGATTQRLSAGTGSFEAGQQSPDATWGVDLGANNYQENVIGLEIDPSDFANGDFIEFYARNTSTGLIPDSANTVLPRITFSSGTLRDMAATANTVTTVVPTLGVKRAFETTIATSTSISSDLGVGETATVGNNTGDTYSGTQSAELTEQAPTTNKNGTSNAQIESSSWATGDRRYCLFRFPGLSNIPAGSNVISASIRLTMSNQSGDPTATQIQLRRVLRDWVESEVTWNQYSSGNNWATGGAKASTDRSDTVSAFIPMSGSLGDHVFEGAQLDQDVDDIVNGVVSNNGWRLGFDDEDTVGTWTKFWGTQTFTDGQRPQLTVLFVAADATLYEAVISNTTTIISALSVGRDLDTVIASQSVAAAALIRTRGLVVQLNTTTAISAALSIRRNVAATIDSLTALQTFASVERQFETQLDSTTTITANLVKKKQFAATIATTTASSASLVVARGLASQLDIVTTVVPALAVERPIAATVPILTAITATLNPERGLAAALATLTGFDASLHVDRALDATINSVTALSASLTVERPFAASLQSLTTLSAEAQVERSLVTSIPVTTEIDAHLTTQGQVTFETSLDTTTDIAAALSVHRPVAAALISTTTFAGTLSVGRQFAAEIPVLTTVSGSVSIERGLTAAIPSVSEISATMLVERLLQTQIDALTTISPDLTVSAANKVNFAATIATTTGADAELFVERSFSAEISNATTIQPALSANRSFAAQIISETTVAGTLAVGRSLEAQLSSDTTILAAVDVTSTTFLESALATSTTMSASLDIRRAAQSEIAVSTSLLFDGLLLRKALQSSIEVNTALVPSLFAFRPFNVSIVSVTAVSANLTDAFAFLSFSAKVDIRPLFGAYPRIEPIIVAAPDIRPKLFGKLVTRTRFDTKIRTKTRFSANLEIV